MKKSILPETVQRNILKDNKPILSFNNNSNLLWKLKLKKKLLEILKLPKKKQRNKIFFSKTEIRENIIIKKYYFISERNIQIPFYYLISKKNIKKKTIPLFICLHGNIGGAVMSFKDEKKEKKRILYKVKKKIKSFLNIKMHQEKELNFALQAVNQGYAAIALELRGYGESLRIKNNKTKDHKKSSMYTSAIDLLIGKTMMGSWVYDLKQLLNIILSTKLFSKIDKKKIVCAGHSIGGLVAFYTSCIDKRINFLIMSGSFCKYIKGKINVIEKVGLAEIIPGYLNYFDLPDLTALICPRPLIIITGKKDRLCPIKSVKDSYIKALHIYNKFSKSKKNCKLIVAEGGHSIYGNITWPVFNNITKWKH